MKRIGLIALLLVVLGGGFFVVRTLGHPAAAQTVATSTSTASTGHGTSVSKKSNTSGVSELSGMTLTSVSGKTITVNPNQKTILHFMVSSCGTCVGTEIGLTKFAHTPGVQIVSVDVDPQNDSLSTIQSFKKATKASWPYVMDTNQLLVKQFNVSELDTVVVLYHDKVILDEVAPSVSTLQKVLA
ncbi:TlpA family protein disulfide reductase [Alicyclobacillus ferrooxydans]|uniref:Thioredoxin domain-containing protein n=1 Tax=Alicyclobacillus ferrooxydans TaxID=471514 RepID=A0A0P9CSA0_9BACL|nr:redoxin domain-containing protein [Alicyclobacillus ferrooxydans]KPV45705.1 hypothetical protein AN477_02035 [Alicyclobacillus ferrooxydans]